MEKEPDKIKKERVLRAHNKDEKEDSYTHSRRTLLAGIMGTTLGGYLAGVVGIDTAEASHVSDKERKRLALAKRKYQSKDDIESVVAGNKELLAELADQGLLSTPSVRSIPFDKVLSNSEFANAKAGATVTSLSTSGESMTVQIQIKWQTAGRNVALIARPEKERIYAVADAVSEPGRVLIEPTNEKSTTEITVSEPCVSQEFCYFIAGAHHQEFETLCCLASGTCELGPYIGLCNSIQGTNCFQACYGG